MLRVAPVDPSEVPRTGDDLSIAFSGTWASLEQDERLDIHRTVGQQRALFDHWVRSYPNAVLQVAETAVLQIASQLVSCAAAGFWHIKQDQAPKTVPPPCPARLRVASAQGLEASRLRQSVQ